MFNLVPGSFPFTQEPLSKVLLTVVPEPPQTQGSVKRKRDEDPVFIRVTRLQSKTGKPAAVPTAITCSEGGNGKLGTSEMLPPATPLVIKRLTLC